MKACIVACGSEKQAEDVPAGEMYVNSYSRKMADIAETHFDQQYILSAFYGLIPFDMTITPYNVHIDDVNQDVWLTQVLRNIRRYGLDQEGVEIWLLIPKDYHQAGPDSGPVLREEIEQMDCEAVYPYDATGGIGYQKGWLKDCQDAGELFHPEEGDYA